MEKKYMFLSFKQKSGSKTTSECLSEETKYISARGDESHDTQELMTSETKSDDKDTKQSNTNSQTSENKFHNQTDVTNTGDLHSKIFDTNVQHNSDSNLNDKGGHLGEGETLSNDMLEEESEDEEESDDDDDDGWITPSNIKTVKEKMGEMDTERGCIPVGCLTTDFAIQVNLGARYLFHTEH